MPSTALQIIQFVQQDRYPYLTTTAGLNYINRTNEELLAMFGQFRRHSNTTPQIINVVAGTKEYDVNIGSITGEFISQIEEVELTIGSVTTKLRATNLETLNRASIETISSSPFRVQAQGTPAEFYTAMTSNSVIIGLHPSPDENGELKIWGSASKVLTSAQSVFPVFSDELYYEAICYRFAKARQKWADAQGYYMAYVDQLTKLENWLETLNESYQGGVRNVRSK